MALPDNIYILLLVTLCVQAFVDLILPYNPSKTQPIFWRLGTGLAGFFSAKLDRERRSAVTRSARGAFFLMVLVVCGFGLGFLLKMLGGIFLFAQDAFIFLSFCLCLGFVKYVKTHTRLWRLLQETPPERAVIVKTFQDMGMPVPRISKDLEPYMRVGVISVGYHVNIMLIGPLFWMFVLGYGGMFFYCLVMAASIVLPRQQEFDFGWATRMTARILDIVPGFITSLLLCLAAWATLGAKPVSALKSVLRHSASIISHGVLSVQAVMAGAIGGALGGLPQHWYIDKDIGNMWLGSKRDSARITAQQLRAAIRLSVIFYLILLVLVVLGCLKTML